MRKELIGKGKEHKVYVDPADPDYVIKYPRLYNITALRLFFNGVKTVERDVKEAEEMVKHTIGEVLVPDTTVQKTKLGSYRMRQKRVESDGSVPDARQKLLDHGLVYLAGRCYSSPDNFIDSEGKVNIIDPTIFIGSRLVKKWGIDQDKYRKFLKRRKEIQEKIISKPKIIFQRKSN